MSFDNTTTRDTPTVHITQGYNGPIKTVPISNSELETEQRCSFRAYLAHGEELRRKDLGEALNRGNFGHKVFETYFLARMSGMNHADARQEMYAFFIPESLRIANPAITGVHEQIEAAIEWFNNMGYIPHEVEQVKKYPIPGVYTHPMFGDYQLVFCMTPDLIMEGTKANHDKGQRVVIDFKMTGQFWNEQKIRLYQQIPKYIKALNEYEDYGIKRGILMQINTRTNKSANANLFLPKWITPTQRVLDQFWDENVQLMHRFAEKKLMALGEWARHAPRTINTSDCAWCPFSADLCPQMLEGQNVKNTLAAFYMQNDYKYHVTDDEINRNGHANGHDK